MIERQRGSGEVVLHCVGRDIENLELHLKRNGARWVAEEKITPKPRDIFFFHDARFYVGEKLFQRLGYHASRRVENAIWR